MKKVFIWLLALIFAVGMVYMGIGCKEDVVPAEEAAEEEVAEEAAEEEVSEEEALPPMEERTPLEFWYNATSPEAYLTLFQKFSDEVWPLEIINIPGPMEEPILTKWAAGERPDIIDFHAELKWFYQLQPEKNLIDLSDMEFVERTKYNMLENSIGCIGPQGQVWGPVIIPQNYMAVIYNKLIFEELNLSIPKDATEFTALCQKIKDAGYTPMYSAAQDAWPTQIEHHALMADMIKTVEESTGNKWWDEINAGVRDFDDGTSRPIIDLIISWVEAGYYQEDLATGTYEKSMSAIMNSDVAMVWNGQWMLASLVDSFGLEEVNKTIGMYGLSMPKILWDEIEEVPEDKYIIPLGKANIVSSGNDLTIVAYGYQVRQAKKAIESLPNYSIELIDLQTLDPLDMDTIIASVSKTRKLLLIQKDYQKCSLSEHIAYNVSRSVSFKSKIEIISSKYAPITFSPALEEDLLPQVCDITDKVKEILG